MVWKWGYLPVRSLIWGGFLRCEGEGISIRITSVNEVAVPWFFGCFFWFFQAAERWTGNMIKLII